MGRRQLRWLLRRSEREGDMYTGRRTEITLLKLSSDVALDKGSLSGATVTHQKHFELGSLGFVRKRREEGGQRSGGRGRGGHTG